MMMEKVVFDYSKLRGRIIEKYRTQSNFAYKVGMSNRSMSLKLNNGIAFGQKDIIRWCDLLDIQINDIPEYFFNKKV